MDVDFGLCVLCDTWCTGFLWCVVAAGVVAVVVLLFDVFVEAAIAPTGNRATTEAASTSLRRVLTDGLQKDRRCGRGCEIQAAAWP